MSEANKLKMLERSAAIACLVGNVSARRQLVIFHWYMTGDYRLSQGCHEGGFRLEIFKQGLSAGFVEFPVSQAFGLSHDLRLDILSESPDSAVLHVRPISDRRFRLTLRPYADGPWIDLDYRDFFAIEVALLDIAGWM